jgi:hypothetical protein
MARDDARAAARDQRACDGTRGVVLVMATGDVAIKTAGTRD